MALVSMAMLFMAEERERHKEGFLLLICSNIETLLKTYMPRKGIEHDEVLRQMEKQQRRRQASIDLAFNKQARLSTS